MKTIKVSNIIVNYEIFVTGLTQNIKQSFLLSETFAEKNLPIFVIITIQPLVKITSNPCLEN